jgi:6-phosphogluconolactonase
MVPKSHRVRTLAEVHRIGTHWQKRILPSTFGLIFAVLLMNGCSGGMKSIVAPGPTGSFAFIANSGSGNVSAFAVGSNSVLSSVPGSPFPAGAGAEFMALDSVHRFLYVSNQNSDDLSGFSVNASTGGLTPVLGSPFATGASPHGVVVDAAGKFVFVGNQNSGTISAFSINSGTGTLTPVPGSPFTGVASPFGLAISPGGTFLYVNDINTNTVSGFSIDPNTGGLAAVPGAASPTGQTPIGILADPNGKFLYVGDHMQDTISGYRIDRQSGALTRISGPAVPSTGCPGCHMNTRPLRLVVHPKNNFAYASNVAANTLSVFGLNNGILSPISAPVPTGQHPFGVALDPSGSFLYVANKVGNTISAFSVDPMTGTLSPLPGSPFSAGGSAPTGIVTIPRQ